jgi:hypothetical protein
MAVNLNSITGIPYMDTLLGFGSNMNVIFIGITVVLGFFLLFTYLGGSKKSESVIDGVPGTGQPTTSKSKSALEIMIWGIFIVLVLLNGMSYFLNINITASIKNLFGKTPEVDVLVDPDTAAGDPNSISSSSSSTGAGSGTGDDDEGDDVGNSDDEDEEAGEVFHIPGNNYKFNDAQAVCGAYGAKLANYKQIEKAYKNGGDWCSYGWSADQMAFYPTQYDKWQNLQSIKGHKHDCGRPGINGGYIKNPNVKFGVNCFGKKPEITEYESELMNESSLYPKTRKEVVFDKKVQRYKSEIPNILLAPFNRNNWKEV